MTTAARAKSKCVAILRRDVDARVLHKGQLERRRFAKGTRFTARRYDGHWALYWHPSEPPLGVPADDVKVDCKQGLGRFVDLRGTGRRRAKALRGADAGLAYPPQPCGRSYDDFRSGWKFKDAYEHVAFRAESKGTSTRAVRRELRRLKESEYERYKDECEQQAEYESRGGLSGFDVRANVPKFLFGALAGGLAAGIVLKVAGDKLQAEFARDSQALQRELERAGGGISRTAAETCATAAQSQVYETLARHGLTRARIEAIASLVQRFAGATGLGRAEPFLAALLA